MYVYIYVTTIKELKGRLAQINLTGSRKSLKNGTSRKMNLHHRREISFDHGRRKTHLHHKGFCATMRNRTSS